MSMWMHTLIEISQMKLLNRLRWHLCMECDEGKWYEYEGGNEFTTEQCSCWNESWYKLFKGYIRIHFIIARNKIYTALKTHYFLKPNMCVRAHNYEIKILSLVFFAERLCVFVC